MAVTTQSRHNIFCVISTTFTALLVDGINHHLVCSRFTLVKCIEGICYICVFPCGCIVCRLCSTALTERLHNIALTATTTALSRIDGRCDTMGIEDCFTLHIVFVKVDNSRHFFHHHRNITTASTHTARKGLHFATFVKVHSAIGRMILNGVDRARNVVCIRCRTIQCFCFITCKCLVVGI